MHNWEHYGRLPAYFLAATLVASCGGGDGGGLLGTPGESSAKLEVLAAGTKLTIAGQADGSIKLTDSAGVALKDKNVSLSLRGTNGVTLSKSEVQTDSNGSAVFSLVGNGTEVEGKKFVLVAKYTDNKGDIKTSEIEYQIVDITGVQSAYQVEGKFKKDGKCDDAAPSSISLTVSGIGSSATACFVIYTIDKNDSTKKIPVAEQKVAFSLLNPINGSLSSLTGVTKSSGVVEVVVRAASSASSNALVMTVIDKNGVSKDSSVTFDTVVGNRVSLLAARDALLSGGDSVDLTAVVISPTGNVQPNVPVTFALANTKEKGVTLKPADVLTDTNGRLKATLTIDNSTGADFSLHDIVVNATIGTGSNEGEIEPVTLKVEGTTIDLAANKTNLKAGESVDVTATLKNGKGQAVSGQTLAFVGSNLSVSNASKVTDTKGQATITVTAPTQGLSTLTVKGLKVGGINAQGEELGVALPFSISAENFSLSLSKPKPSINESVNLLLNFSSGAGGLTNKSVKVTTSLGKVVGSSTVPLQPNTAGTELLATVPLVSDFPGRAIVKVDFLDPQLASFNSAIPVDFVSTIPAKLDIQAVNPILAANGQTNIVATVVDDKDNPVADAEVSFNLENPLGGTLNTPSVKTDSNGKAIVTFTAGSNTTGTEKIKVVAKIDQDSNVSASELNLTVGGKAVFLSIATGNEIQEITSTTYAVPYQVTVTDATGAPVSNTEVKLSVWPVNYYKGKYVFSVEAKLWVATYTAQCSNEDADQNGFLDVWENNSVGDALGVLDYPAGEEKDVEDNGDGKLWPGNPVTLSTSTLITGADGIAYFNVLYGQSYANWLRVKLTAKAQVSGTESKADSVFSLPASSEDLSDEKKSPPGGTQSAFGSASVCSDFN